MSNADRFACFDEILSYAMSQSGAREDDELVMQCRALLRELREAKPVAWIRCTVCQAPMNPSEPHYRYPSPAPSCPEGLFQMGSFTLHGGQPAQWKIDCDALTDKDIATIALMLSERLPSFGSVEGVPSGGLRIAAAMQTYATVGPLLIVDDVLTTGGSMETQRAGREAVGAVIFARGPCPAWVTPLFTLPAAPCPEGWQLVPKEPTPEMLEAAQNTDAIEAGCVGIKDEIKNEIWPAMLAAAPSAPGVEGETTDYDRGFRDGRIFVYRSALEDAAQICEAMTKDIVCPDECAAAIRARAKGDSP